MRNKVNAVSILRKRVVTNIPGFSDDETGNPQNEWIKLYDFNCVDIAPSNTARVYNLEDAPAYSNNDTTYYVEFHFESARQRVKPPYTIDEGDYVGYYQNGEKHYCRIAKIVNAQLFVGCCVYQIICNVTNPREVERMQGCGLLSVIPDEEFDPDESGESGHGESGESGESGLPITPFLDAAIDVLERLVAGKGANTTQIDIPFIEDKDPRTVQFGQNLDNLTVGKGAKRR